MAAVERDLLLGIDALQGIEAEHSDCLLALFPPTPGLLPSTLVLAPALRRGSDAIAIYLPSNDAILPRAIHQSNI